ncbi:MAG TPA: hypothetical protein VL242_48110 [Sorangium sp.]|nr:hypothetical protein [Sorangium sp.]
MVFMTPGKQLTAGELDELLRGCGFTDVSVTPAYAGYSLISARRPAAPRGIPSSRSPFQRRD